jgi:putative oxidoreductase
MPSMASCQIRYFSRYMAAVVVSAAFFFSAMLHLANPFQFHLDLLRYELMFPSMASYAVFILPIFNLLLSVMILARINCNLVGKVAAIWLILLAAFQAIAIARGLEIACGCFGSVREPISFLTIFRNVALAGLAWFTGETEIPANKRAV